MHAHQRIKWRSAAVDLVSAGKVSRDAETNLLRPRLFTKDVGERHGTWLERRASLTLDIQPGLKGDELFDL